MRSEGWERYLGFNNWKPYKRHSEREIDREIERKRERERERERNGDGDSTLIHKQIPATVTRSRHDIGQLVIRISQRLIQLNTVTNS